MDGRDAAEGRDPLRPLADGMLPAALRLGDSRGRRHPEPEHPERTPFQRDRDRVIHAAAFRRLEGKTQVFITGEGDNYRTRLTHTLEVTQIARSLARALHLNEDLAEAIALSHDLGHTPFGHAGERILEQLLADQGGFNHNVQGLRVVDFLERRYAAFPGLNLSFEVREGFARHGAGSFGAEFPLEHGPLLEMAAALAADDIAYMAHDLDDGLYSGLLSIDELSRQELWRLATREEGFAAFSPSLKRTEGVRRLINLLVTDATAASRRKIADLGLDSPAKARAAGTAAVVFSPEMEALHGELKRFLYRNLYRHPEVMRVMEAAQAKLAALFALYAADPEKMPAEYRVIADREGARRAAADYVAGMTDHFALDECRRHTVG